MRRVQSQAEAEPEPSAALVRAQLNRILASPLFSRSDRLTAFLTFIVEETLDGRADTLKEQTIANEVYGKGPDFAAAADPIVRVDARRLRDRLREYYESASHDPLVISVPKGSYAPDFEIVGIAPPVPAIATRSSDGAPIVESRSPAFGRVWLASVTVVVIGTIAWLATGRSEPPPVRLLTVTAFPGLEGGPPALSPDGNFVAFSWTGPNFLALGDLWVKAVDGDALRRLTETPSINEIYPAWSPDGRSIAFSRIEGEENLGVYVISPLGGSERRIVEWGWRASWLPDSQSLVIDGRTAGRRALVHHVLDSGIERPLTTPPTGFSDVQPKVSPDGKRVAFVRTTRGQAALFVVPIAGGEAVRLDDWVRELGPPEWTPDGREIFYLRWDTSGSRVFRVAVSGGPAAPAAGLPTESMGVSLSGFRTGRTFRVAVVASRSDIGLRMIDLKAPPTDGRLSAWTPLADSTRLDWPARFSRDGTRVSFTSDRNGPQQIFMANRDGSGVQLLTAVSGVSAGFASWSPDGRSLVFDAVASDNLADLYVTGLDGGPLRRLTHDDKRETNPEWSRDGRWIYFASDASGRAEIWKMPAAGGTSVQLTTEGGSEPRESPDGRDIYYVEPLMNQYATTPIKRVSVDGGSAVTVLPGIWRGAWDVTDNGIVFLAGAAGIAPDATKPDTLEIYTFKDRRTRRLGELPFPVTPRGYSPARVLAASPDGRWVVVSHMDDWQRDILVADNYR